MWNQVMSLWVRLSDVIHLLFWISWIIASAAIVFIHRDLTWDPAFIAWKSHSNFSKKTCSVLFTKMIDHCSERTKSRQSQALRNSDPWRNSFSLFQKKRAYNLIMFIWFYICIYICNKCHLLIHTHTYIYGSPVVSIFRRIWDPQIWIILFKVKSEDNIHNTMDLAEIRTLEIQM